MELLVRTWNLFHGRTHPETRSAHPQRMVRLVTADRPGIVCLQEVPVWATRELESWSGMAALVAVTKHAWLGPAARIAQRLDARRVRSSLTGQASAVLVRRDVEIRSTGVEQVSERGERRVCQLVGLRHTGAELLVANIHLTNRADAAGRELERVARLVGEGPCVVAGDLNLVQTGLPDFSPPISGIDQILVRGVEIARQSARLPDERRRLGSVLLSDHAPIEAAMMWP